MGPRPHRRLRGPLGVTATAGLDLLRPELAEVYDAVRDAARGARRPALPAPRRGARLHGRRARALARRCSTATGGPFIVGMLVASTSTSTTRRCSRRSSSRSPGVYAPRRAPSRRAAAATGELDVRAGRSTMGADGDGFAYDNERPRHEVELAAFRIDRAPVTNAAYLEFVEDGGYRRRELWSEEGWAFRRARGLGAAALLDRGRRRAPLRRGAPTRADAARDARVLVRGRRVRPLARRPPAERGRVGAGGGRGGRGARGHLDQLDFGPGPAGPFLGDCWEWTASEFGGYPGFEAFPYREYSEVFFDRGYRVLRGASWATRPGVARTTFRNWDLPQRRQIFAGFRCAEELDVSTVGRSTAATVLRRRSADDVRDGLTRSLKELPPKYFYDERGSELFDRITSLPEYYPTPLRALDPQPPRAGDRRRRAAPRSSWSSAPAPPRRRARCCTRWRARARCGATCPSTWTSRWCEACARRAGGALPRPRGARRGRRLRARPRAHARRRAAAVRLPRRHDRQPLPGRSARASCAGCAATMGPRRPARDRHRPREGPSDARGRLQRQRGRDGRVQPQRAAGDQRAASTRTSTPTPSSTWPSSTRPTPGSRCGCARTAPSTCSIDGADLEVALRRRRGDPHRDQREVHA